MAKIPRRTVLRGASAAGAVTASTVGTGAAAAATPAGGTRHGVGGQEPTVKTPVTTNVPRGLEDDFDPYYNVVRGRAPASYHPWVGNRVDRILLYTRTAGPRHAHLGPALPAGLNPTLTPAHVLQNAMIKWM